MKMFESVSHKAGQCAVVDDDGKVLDVLIVGGGLSGLSLAYELHKANTIATTTFSSPPPLSCTLVEATSTLGGRLTNDKNGDGIDLGGAWIWNGQRHMFNLLEELNLPTFVQADDETRQSRRVEGGAVTAIDRLAEILLPSGMIQTNFAVTECKMIVSDGEEGKHERMVAMVRSDSGQQILARKVVFAVPPKMLSMHVKFSPDLSRDKKRAMKDSNTWMAGVTKVSLIYDSRFWQHKKEHGSSSSDDDGAIILPTNLGLAGKPAFQVYDASTCDWKTSALTFFALATEYNGDDEKLSIACIDQLLRTWKRMGLPMSEKVVVSMARSYTRIHVKHWPLEEYISEDQAPTGIHPHPNVVKALSTLEWDGILHFAGTECDLKSPGLMEGAVGSAIRVTNELKVS